jgi:hypothetical protein
MILMIVVALFGLGLGFLSLRDGGEGIITLDRLILRSKKKRQNSLTK